jgi:ABC-2 type transport system permease protein
MTTAELITAPRTGAAHWLRGFVLQLRFLAYDLRQLIPIVVVIQTLMGAGMAVFYGFYLPEITPEAATFLVTGAPALALFPIGMVLIPNIIGQQRLRQTYDFDWSLPLPRSAIALAQVGMFTVLALPGTVLALLVAIWRYGIDLNVSLMVIPAILLVALMASSVGFGLGHGIADARILNLITNLLVFFILLFSPIVWPADLLPDWLLRVHEVLPFFPMATVIRDALSDGLVTGVLRSYVVLALWTAAGWGVAAWVVGRRG